MKRKFLLLLTAVAVLAMAGACKPKDNGGEQLGPGPEPGPASEITTNNEAPAGFADEGPMNWDD